MNNKYINQEQNAAGLGSSGMQFSKRRCLQFCRNGLTGQSPVEQLTSGHISPFNDGQGFFAQFDPSKD